MAVLLAAIIPWRGSRKNGGVSESRRARLASFFTLPAALAAQC
jgi:hypothetical protein